VSLGGGGFRIPGNPGEFRKGDAKIRFAGGKGRCKCCGNPTGRPFIVQAGLGAPLKRELVATAFDAGLEPLTGPLAVGVLSHWPRKWGEKGRAPGRPCGDVDAPLSNLLDGLAGTLYPDDAHVGLLVAANAYDAARPRIEVVARPITTDFLALLTVGLGLPFDTARLSTGNQVPL
jgi:hypothetical protein